MTTARAPVSQPSVETNPSESIPNLGDHRQSEAALAIARGARRCLLAHGLSTITELTLANGRRADLAALSDSGEFWIVEIKSSLADFRGDQKWQEYREYCDRLYFAVNKDFPAAALPEECGLILADRYGGEIVRDAPEHKLSAARRKAVMHRFARIASLRLHALADPEIGLTD